MKIAVNFATRNFGYENKITGLPHLKQKFKMNILLQGCIMNHFIKDEVKISFILELLIADLSLIRVDFLIKSKLDEKST